MLSAEQVSIRDDWKGLSRVPRESSFSTYHGTSWGKGCRVSRTCRQRIDATRGNRMGWMFRQGLPRGGVRQKHQALGHCWGAGAEQAVDHARIVGQQKGLRQPGGLPYPSKPSEPSGKHASTSCHPCLVGILGGEEGSGAQSSQPQVKQHSPPSLRPVWCSESSITSCLSQRRRPAYSRQLVGAEESAREERKRESMSMAGCLQAVGNHGHRAGRCKHPSGDLHRPGQRCTSGG